MAKRKLTKVDEHWIKSNKTKPVDELAEDVGATKKAVQDFLETLPKDDSFERNKGVVSITEEQSRNDEESSKTVQNKAFYKTLENSIHKIDPNKPIM